MCAVLIADTMNRYCIYDKVIRVVCDNCNLMKKVPEYLYIPKFPCICHIIHKAIEKFISDIPFVNDTRTLASTLSSK